MNTATPLTAADLLQVGHWFQREGHLFEITAWDAAHPLQVEARAVDRTIHTFTLTELFAPTPPTRFAATQAELQGSRITAPTPSPVADAVTLPANLLKHADRIIQVVEAVQQQIDEETRRHCLAAMKFSLTDLTCQACQRLPAPISLDRYYVFRRLYQIYHADRALIAAALHRNTFGKTRIDAHTQHFIDTIMRRFYRSNPPLRVQTVYTIAEQLWEHNRHWWLKAPPADPAKADPLMECLLSGRAKTDDLLTDPVQATRLIQIQLPSRSWFYGYVSWFTAQPGDGAAAYVMRHGQADWDANFLLFDRFAQTATLPLQYVFADHYKLDVLCVDDEFREALGRLWLTVLIDAYSRAVLGFWLAYEDPNIESIQGALRHAIWPKTGLAELGIDLPWACYGIPQRLFLDNAWAHQSYSLEDLARMLADGGRYTAMELVLRPPYQARVWRLGRTTFWQSVRSIAGAIAGRHFATDPAALAQREPRRMSFVSGCGTHHFSIDRRLPAYTPSRIERFDTP